MKDPAILFYTSDFLTGTMLMNFAQRGKYITLLCLQHQQGRLTEDDMLSVCGEYDKKIFSKFSIDENGLYYNERMEQEATKRRKFVESRQRNLSKTNHKESHMEQHMDNHMGKHKESHMENENINENININELVNRVIDYLNIKCKTRYKANTNDVKKHLIARINEGYTYEDFVKVIDIKCAEWKGTEFEKFLRPATLFGSKFQSYLNQPVKETSYGDADSFFEIAVKRTYEDDD